jgi:hypothetical protein
MDIEQLKLVIEAVKSVSGDAQAVAIWWLVLDKLLPVIAWLLVGAGVFNVVCKIIKEISKAQEDTIRLIELKNIMCPNDSRYPFISNENWDAMKKLAAKSLNN